MIPDIHEILEMVKAGECTVQQALKWIELHMERADLRDHFAGIALSSVITMESFGNVGFKLVDGKSMAENNALAAYHQADAMLEARKASA